MQICILLKCIFDSRAVEGLHSIHGDTVIGSNPVYGYYNRLLIGMLPYYCGRCPDL